MEPPPGDDRAAEFGIISTRNTEEPYGMPYLDMDEGLVKRFLATITQPAPRGRKKEQVVQDFLEANTELIPTPAPATPALHMSAVISKFRISPSLVTDYAYLNKNSARWDVTLVELEAPEKRFFTGDLGRTCASAQFNAALAQVEQWQRYVDQNKAEVVRLLKPIMQGALRDNPIKFRYQLIYGRSKEKNRSDDAKAYVSELEERRGIRVLSYDSLIGLYKTSPRIRKNVMRQVGERYGFKFMLDRPRQIFSAMGPQHIEIDSEQAACLTENGYDIKAWKGGELLSVGETAPMSKAGSPDAAGSGLATRLSRKQVRSLS